MSRASIVARRHAARGDAAGYAWQCEMEGTLRGPT